MIGTRDYGMRSQARIPSPRDKGGRSSRIIYRGTNTVFRLISENAEVTLSTGENESESESGSGSDSESENSSSCQSGSSSSLTNSGGCGSSSLINSGRCGSSSLIKTGRSTIFWCTSKRNWNGGRYGGTGGITRKRRWENDGDGVTKRRKILLIPAELQGPVMGSMGTEGALSLGVMPSAMLGDTLFDAFPPENFSLELRSGEYGDGDGRSGDRGTAHIPYSCDVRELSSALLQGE